MVLTLQKLIHIHTDDQDSDCGDDEKYDMNSILKPRRSKVSKFLRNMFSSTKAKASNDKNLVAGVHDPANGYITGHTEGVSQPHLQNLQTLQRYHGGPNKERMEYMEKHSPLSRKKLGVSAEQVSIFLTSGMLVVPLLQP